MTDQEPAPGKAEPPEHGPWCSIHRTHPSDCFDLHYPGADGVLIVDDIKGPPMSDEALETIRRWREGHG
jgi:hypothetical protein